MNIIEVTDQSNDEILSRIKVIREQGNSIWLSMGGNLKKLILEDNYDVQLSYKLKNNGALDQDSITNINNNLQTFGDDKNGPSRKPSGDFSFTMIEKTQAYYPQIANSQGQQDYVIAQNHSQGSFNNNYQQINCSSPMMQSPQIEQFDENVYGHYQVLEQAMQLDKQGDIIGAKNSLIELVNELEKLIGINSYLIRVIYFEAACSLGLLYSRIGQYMECKLYLYITIRLLEKLIRVFEIKDVLLKAKIFVKLGQVQYLLLNFPKAIDYFKQALDIFDNLQLRSEISVILAQLGVVYAHVGHKELSKKLVSQAHEIVYEMHHRESLIHGIIFHYLGEVCLLNDDVEDAMDYFDQSLDIKKKHSSDKFSQILSLNYIGICCYKIKELEKSLEIYENIFELLDEPGTLTEAQMLNNRGVIKKALQMDHKQDFDKALQIYINYFPQNHPSVKRTIRNLRPN